MRLLKRSLSFFLVLIMVFNLFGDLLVYAGEPEGNT